MPKLLRKPAAHYHHGDLRRALISAALELIADRGPEGWTLREAARRTGVSQTAPYRHFRDKGELLEAVAAEGFASLTKVLVESTERCRTPRTRAEALARSYFDFAVANPSHFRVMFSGVAAAAPEGNEALEEARRFVLDEQKAGRMRSGDALMLARTLWAAVHGVASLVVGGGLEEAEGRRILKVTVDAVLEGVSPGSSR